MSSFFSNKKRLFLLVLPVAVLVLGAGLVLSSSGDDEGNASISPSSQSASGLDIAPTSSVGSTTTANATPLATAQPEAAAASFRTDCVAIQGSQYESNEEREWYLANCKDNPVVVAAAAQAVAQAAATSDASSSGGGGGSQGSTGDRLVISKIGVNAYVDSAQVFDGYMPDPVSYFNAVWYDFVDDGLGGYPTTGGNTVLAGHVDSARYGAVVFYNLNNLGAGDSIEYYTSGGGSYRYVVTSVGDYLPSDNWRYIVSSSTADMTIITCIGAFSAGEYSHRRVVFARRV